MKRLLIIEDDKIDQMAFERFVKNVDFPFTYQLVSSILEAKEALQNNKFDAILTDYFLGDGTMFEILNLNLNIPVIITTGTGNELIAVKAIQKGAFDYLIKDIDGNYLKVLPITIKNAIHHFDIKRKNLAYQLNLEYLVEERTENLKLEIAKSKTLENSLRAERDKFNFILEALPIGVSVLDIENKITYINQKSIEIEGDSEHTKKIIGKTVQSIHPKQNQDKIAKLLSDFKSGKQSTYTRETKINERTIDIAYHAIRDSKNNYSGLIRLISDITEKRKLERDFIHVFIDAQEQEKQSLGEELHDGISQTLSAESMYIQVLRTLIESNDKRVVEALEKIGTLNYKVITDARNLANGLMSKQLKEDGLLKAIENICVDYSLDRDIAFKFKHSGLKEDDFNKDVKTNLFRIIQEISTNTLKYSLAKTMTITLTRLRNDSIKLVLKDDGVGIDFERMKREKKGAGIKNIERHVILLNGKTTLETAPNKGTCYTITIPLQPVE